MAPFRRLERALKRAPGSCRWEATGPDAKGRLLGSRAPFQMSQMVGLSKRQSSF